VFVRLSGRLGRIVGHPLLAAAVLASALILRWLPWHCDDAFIVYRVARNLIQGYGWCYNVGEAYNPVIFAFNTVLTALGGLFGLELPFIGHLVGGLAIVVVGGCLHHLLRPTLGDFCAMVAAFASMGWLAANRTWGLETNLLIAVIFLFLAAECPGRLAPRAPLGLGFALWSLGTAACVNPNPVEATYHAASTLIANRRGPRETAGLIEAGVVGYRTGTDEPASGQRRRGRRSTCSRTSGWSI